MAVDRYRSICFPMRHRCWRRNSRHGDRRRVAQVWALALALCLPQALVFGRSEEEEEQVGCAADLGDGKFSSFQNF